MALYRNQVRDHFLSDANAQWLAATLEDRLTAALAQSASASAGARVRVPLDDLFVTEMLQVADSSLNPPAGTLGLAAMNRTFLNRMFKDRWQGLVQGMLYNTYELSQNRPRTQPYGQYVGKDAVTVSPSAYNLSHPFAAQQASFLMATTGLQAVAPAQQSVATQASGGQLFVQDAQYCRGRRAQQAQAVHL